MTREMCRQRRAVVTCPKNCRLGNTGGSDPTQTKHQRGHVQIHLINVGAFKHLIFYLFIFFFFCFLQQVVCCLVTCEWCKIMTNKNSRELLLTNISHTTLEYSRLVKDSCKNILNVESKFWICLYLEMHINSKVIQVNS